MTLISIQIKGCGLHAHGAAELAAEEGDGGVALRVAERDPQAGHEPGKD